MPWWTPCGPSCAGPRIRYANLGATKISVGVSIPQEDKRAEAEGMLRALDTDFEVTIGEGGRITLTLTEVALRERRLAAVNQSIEIVRRRIDETGVREPTIQRQGEERILVQLPGIDDPERIKSLLGKTAKMNFHLVDNKSTVRQALGGRVPPGSILSPSADEVGPDGRPRMYLVEKRVRVSGESLVDAQPSFDQRTNEPIVSFRFDSAGGRRFGDITQQNVGRLLAIVLDGKVISAPVIREPILGGNGQISGSFTVQGAQDLALLLRAGALPAPLVILEERTVGPGMGADSIASGKVASIIGMVLVVVFMAAVYGRFGLMADVALLFNMVIIVGALSVLQATLTLPGIAGIVLTIGMAVGCQRADLRAYPRGGAGRKDADLGHRRRLFPGHGDHHRRQRHHADRRLAVVRVRQRSGSGVRGHPRHRHHHVHVHGHYGHPLDGCDLAAPQPAAGSAPMSTDGIQPCSC